MQRSEYVALMDAHYAKITEINRTNGHELNEANLFEDKFGRHCRVCMNERQRRYRAKRKKAT